MGQASLLLFLRIYLKIGHCEESVTLAKAGVHLKP
jgi:hypothetical protein